MDLMTTFLPLLVLIVLMYFFMIKPQKKREKEAQDMRNSVQPGDEIITIGGICGKVVKTKEESIVIQVGADKVKFEIMRWAISKVEPGTRTKKNAPVEEDAPTKSLPKRLKKSENVVEETPAVAEEAPVAEVSETPAE